LCDDENSPLCKHDIDKPLEIHSSRRNTIITAALAGNAYTGAYNNTEQDDMHHSHNSIAGPSHSSSSVSTGNNNGFGMEGFQVIIV
jgi:hypothetical protein